MWPFGSQLPENIQKKKSIFFTALLKSKFQVACQSTIISPLIMVRFEPFKNRVTAEDLLYHVITQVAHFGALGANQVRESALFGALGA